MPESGLTSDNLIDLPKVQAPKVKFADSEMARQPLLSADLIAVQLFVKRCESMQQMAEYEDLPHRWKQVKFQT